LGTIQEKDKKEEEENKQKFEENRIEKWDKDKIGNLWNLYNKLSCLDYDKNL